MEVAGHPLLAYTIRAAIDSEQFSEIMVSTDDSSYASIARHYGASVHELRPAELAKDSSPDIDWIEFELSQLDKLGRKFEQFALLRPTNPFRKKETIRRAMAEFAECPWADSLRAVERTTQHPGKMWIKRGGQLFPVLPVQSGVTDWYSSPTQTLPEVWIQNASLEIARLRNVTEQGSITGNRILGFETQGLEGFDLNTPQDLTVLHSFTHQFQQLLPTITIAPFDSSSLNRS
jgi:N-acylneuraminate cytidylyltransferase